MAEQTALLPISGCEDPERLADVIFVHGLDGDARSTWHPKDQPKHFWPAWLGEEMPQLGVWSLNYAVSASAWKGHSMPLVDRANNVLDLFALEDIGQRPLALICHSLGGLLMKQVLRTAKDAPDPQWQAIVEQTKLMVFLSTPHSGANMASWISYLGTLLRLTVSVEELEAHHPRLRELNIWYRDHVAALGIRTFVYYETLPTARMLVVDATTADPGIPGVRPIPVDEDHVTICKPASKDSRIYRQVKRLIEHSILRADHPPASAAGSGRAGGTAKIEISRRLGPDWQDVADYVEIPTDQRRGFEPGREPQGVWEWLESRKRLPQLAEALRYIGRDDLAEMLTFPPQ
jgi:hypothetical protein